MTRAVFLLFGLLAGCGPEVRDIALADVDLRNMQTVETIRAGLVPEERIAFANYVARHHINSANYCGQPLVGSSGKAPATIGEAVDLAVIRDAAERQLLVESLKPKHPRQIAMEDWKSLISARDMLIDSQSRLRMDYGDKAAQHAEWMSLKSEIAEIDRKLIAMKPKVFGTQMQ